MNGSKRKPGADVARRAVTGAIVVAASVWLAGCAAGSNTNGRTQYKGEAVWDISSADAEGGRGSDLARRNVPAADRKRG